MKIALSVLLFIHSLVHLIGGLQAFTPLRGVQLQPIKPLAGKWWLAASVLFLLSFAFSIGSHTQWWMFGGAAVVLSQVLIFSRWRDAKYGTMLNTILLCAVIAGGAQWNFQRRYVADVAQMLKQAPGQSGLLTEKDIQHLPGPVQYYIRYSGALNTPKVNSFRVTFSGRIRDYEKKQWMNFTSVQYNLLQPAQRLFFLNATMNQLPVAGYHRFDQSAAFMDIRLLSLFTVQYQAGEEMRRAETVTFFNDMCVMAPGTLIDPRIQWTPVDAHRTDATFSNNGITITASLFFNEEGALINFVSHDRYARQADGTMQQMKWLTPLKNYAAINGMYLATDAQAVYAYPDGEFSYGEFHLTQVDYNPVTE